MMTAVCAAALAIAAAPPAETSGDAARTALRRWAQVKDDQAEQAAEEFLVLYEELGRDPALGPATRQQLREQVRARLVKLSGQLSRRVHRRERSPAGKAAAAPRMRPDADNILAQRGPLGGPRGMLPGRGFAAPGPPALRPAAPAAGPARLPPAIRPGGPPDYGQQLVELIQRTIAPASWDVNGGPGTIHYWRPGRALVVRQSDEIHERIGDALEQLDRAGR